MLGFNDPIASACTAHGIVGSEFRSQLQRDIARSVLVRRAQDPVLLCGQTGTGKEVTAAVCHEVGKDVLGRHGPLVELNCANLASNLFESELFGVRRGAYTGADVDRQGLAAAARDGTLLLDEVQALSVPDQAKLLRFLGEREFRAVGGQRTEHCDALILLASNQDLREKVACGEFRADLLDRIGTHITLPALHQRRQDIGELATAFAQGAAASIGVGGAAALSDRTFLGFTRRARTDIESAILLCREGSVRRLRAAVRDMVFQAAMDRLPEVLESEHVLPILREYFGYSETTRGEADRLDVTALEQTLAARRVRDVAARYNVRAATLDNLVHAVGAIIGDMNDQARSYRNVVERTARLSKVALWLVSGANSQVQFRRYFGSRGYEMPPKSVAHQVFHEVFPNDPEVS
jgi:transcriptional regulator with GAF, ATPase, and Fis domain